MRKRGPKPKCIFCGSRHTISRGVRRTATIGERPLRSCRDCGRKFTAARKAAVNVQPPMAEEPV